MAEEFEILQHFSSIEDADRAMEVLQDAGLNAMVLDEAEFDEKGVYAVQVPQSEFERAEAVLAEAAPSEEEEAMEMLNEWEFESDEVRESYEEL